MFYCQIPRAGEPGVGIEKLLLNSTVAEDTGIFALGTLAAGASIVV